jgi:hypothetical protein
MNKPLLDGTQFALLLAESLTGIVLNTDFKRHTQNSNKPVYFIFDDYVSVKEFIKKLNNDSYDYTIYNSEYELVEYIPVAELAKPKEEINIGIFHTVSISGRYVYGYLCLIALMRHQGLEPMPALLDNKLREYVESDSLDVWEDDIEQLLNEDDANSFAPYFRSQPQLFQDVLEDLIELGRGNLYGGFSSKFTFTYIKSIIELLQKNNIKLLDIKIVGQFPLSERHGWGNRISFSSIGFIDL